VLEDRAELRTRAALFGEPPPVEHAPITIEGAVARFLLSKKNENLAESTLGKLRTIFEKQFVSCFCIARKRERRFTRLSRPT
jgi:hypothetical protein